MGRPEFPPPVPDMHIRKLFVRSGDNYAELDGEGIALSNPLVAALIAKVFANIQDPQDQAKIAAATDTLAGSASQLADSVEKGKSHG